MNENDLELAAQAYLDRLGHMAKRYEAEICQLRVQLTNVSNELNKLRGQLEEKNVPQEEK